MIGIFISLSFKVLGKYNCGDMSAGKEWKKRDFGDNDVKSTGFSWKRVLLFLLSTVFDIIVLLTIILLVTGRISMITGVILLIVAIGFSLLSKSFWRSSITSTGAIFVILVMAILLAATLSAYAGMEPFASLKNSLSMWASELAINVWGKLVSVVEFLSTLLMGKR